MQAIICIAGNNGHAASPLFARVPAAIVGDMKLLTIKELRALPDVITGQDRRSGVYFLWDGDELVYVGSGQDTASRRTWHRSSWRYRNLNKGYSVSVKHDGFTTLYVPMDKMLETERAYIKHYRPSGNKRSKPCS